MQTENSAGNRKRIPRKRKKAQGLGDTVERITEATGIKALVKAFTPEGQDCGCDKRKEALNRLFPYRGTNCLVQAEYDYLKAFFEDKSERITPEQQKQLIAIYNRAFNRKKQPTSCGACVRGMIHDLKILFDQYATTESKA